MLNKYIDRLEQLIMQYRSHDLVQFLGPSNEVANWDDLIWYHLDPNTNFRTRFLCGQHGVKGKGSSGNDPKYMLRYPYNYLIKIWIIETCNAPVTSDERKSRVSVARKFLATMSGELYEQTSETVSLILGTRSISRIIPFVAFCTEQKLTRPIQLSVLEQRDRTGHNVFDTRLDKLPEMESILALGTIHRAIFEHVSQNGMIAPNQNVNYCDAFISTFALLGLASPSRLSAEVPVIPKQRLKTYDERGESPVYYLDWFGSKGFRNNRNHILAALADKVDLCINFFYELCEPARILCRFYENPKQTLNELLGDFNVSAERKKNLELKKTTNLFVLGYALGLYEVDECVPILKSSEIHPTGSTRSHEYHRCFQQTPIYTLNNQHMLSAESLEKKSITAALPRLFGFTVISKHVFHSSICKDKNQKIISVGEIQSNWIHYFKNTLLSEFPYSYSTGDSKIKLSDALFCFLGSWFYSYSNGKAGSGGKALHGSHYAIVPLRSLGHKAKMSLSGSNKFLRYHTIFDKYGFLTLHVHPHSLRHFGNTLADLSEIPKEIITAWSGRVDKEQTNTYIHTSHDEKADRVRAIIGKPEHDKRQIRVVTQELLMKQLNLPASITSTGICTNELHISPCDYMNDFISHCFMCSASCYVAGDIKATSFLEKDLAVQTERLRCVSCDQRLKNSIAMQKWFVIHSRNTHILTSLIELLKQLDTGTIVRFSSRTCEFHITDNTTLEIKKNQCSIPDFQEKLQALISQETSESNIDLNPQLQNLLSSFGL